MLTGGRADPDARYDLKVYPALNAEPLGSARGS